MARARKLLRWALAGALILVALALGALVALMIVLRTDYGRDKVRTEIETAIGERLRGEVSIGGLEGPVIGELVVRDVVVRDRDGEVVVEIDRLSLAYEALDLIAKRLAARRVDVEGLVVTDRGTLDTLVIPKDGEPTAWSVDLEAIRVEDSRYRRRRPGEADLDVRAVELAGHLRYSAGDVQAGLSRASAVVDDLAAVINGPIRFTENTLTARDASIAAGDSRLAISAATFEVDSGALDVSFEAELAAADLRRFAPRWRAGASLSGAIRRPAAGAPLHVDVDGSVGEAAVSATLAVDLDPLGARGTVELKNASPRSWIAGAPAGRLDLSAEIDLAKESSGPLTGTAELAASGSIAGAQIDRLAGTVDLERDSLSADLSAAAIGYRDAWIERATVVASGAPLGAEPAIDVELSAGRARYRDATATDLAIDGRLDVGRREGRGTARAARMRYGDVTSTDLAIEGRFDAGRFEGRATARAERLQIGGEQLGPVVAQVELEDRERISASLRAGAGPDFGLALRGTARIGERATQIRVSRLDLRAKEVRWRGDAALAIRDRTVELEHLRVRSTAGAVEASGRIEAGGRRGSLQVAARDLDLEALSASLPGVAAPPLAGVVTGQLELELEPFAIDGRVRFREVAWGTRAPPLGGQLVVTGEGRDARVELEVKGPELGSARLVATLELPDKPLELAGWTELERRQLRELEVALEDVDLARVAALLPEPVELEGQLSGTVELAGGGERFAVDLTLTGARARQVGQPIDLEVEGSGGVDEVKGTIAAAIESRPVIRGDVRVGAGLAALWDRDLDALGKAALEARLEIPGLPVSAVAGYLDSGREIRGEVSGEISASGTVTAPAAELRLRVRDAGAGEVEGLELRATAELDRRRWSASATVTHRGGTLRARGEGGTDLAAPVQAELVADDFEVGALSPAIARADLVVARITGALDVDLDLGGSLASPVITGNARLERGRARLRTGVEVLEDIELEAALTEKQLTVAGRAKSGDGDVTLEGEVALAQLRPQTLAAKLEADNLPFAVSSVEGELDGRLELAGAGRDGGFRLDAALSDGVIRTPERRETRDLHPTEPPADVVFIDPAGIAARRRAERRASQPGPFDPLVIGLTTPGGVRVLSGQGASLRGEVELEITRRRGETTIDGLIETAEGYVVLFDRRYQVNQGLLAFAGESPINPRVALALVHQSGTVELNIDVTGTLAEPSVELSSTPAYSRAELVGFILGGQLGDGTDTGEGLRSGAATLASSFLTGRLESLVAQPLPFDTVRIGTAAESGGVSSVTVGRWVADNVFVAYQLRFGAETDENTNQASIEYRFRPRWILEGVIGDRGNGSVDILWVRRFE